MVRMRTRIVKVLALVGLILLGLLSSKTIVKAEPGDWKATMRDDGTIVYETDDQEASNGTRYRTVGIIIEPHKTNGTPRTKNVGMLLYNGDEAKRDKYLECKSKKGIVHTKYTFPKKEVWACFKKSGVTNETIKGEKGKFYINFIHQVIYVTEDKRTGKKTIKEGKKYYTLDGIRDAKSWKNKSGFKHRFDVEVPVNGEIDVQRAFYIKENKKLTEYDRKTIDEVLPLGKYKENGKDVPKTITANGRKFYLYRSSYSTLDKPIKKQNNGTDGSYREQKKVVYAMSNPLKEPEKYEKELIDVRYREYNINNIENDVIHNKRNGLEIAYWYRPCKVPPPQKDENETREKEDTIPNAECTIQSMDRNASEFNSIKGIPSSENQYVSVMAKRYLYSYKFKRYYGKKNYLEKYMKPVPSDNGFPKYEPDFREVERSYSYWKIDSLAVYKIDHAEIKNESIRDSYGGGDKLKLVPVEEHYLVPQVTYCVYSDNLQDPDGIESEHVGEIKVKNDKLVIDGYVVMADIQTYGSTPEPNEIETAPRTKEEAMLRENILIEPTLANDQYETDASITYKCISKYGSIKNTTITEEIEYTNDVIVHTPTICKPVVSDERMYNQQCRPDQGAINLVLDRTFSIQFEKEGWHSDLKGYQYRNYAKYIATDEVRFPFDVYRNGVYFPANTWLAVNGTETFYLPTWVAEGYQTLEFRSTAINGIEDRKDNEEEDANTMVENYTATYTTEVFVSGRVFGLTQYDISNYPLWRDTFRKPNSLMPSGFNYRVGTNTRNGISSGRYPKYTLPIVNGGHPLFTNLGIQKLGYVSRFYLTTIGDLRNDKDIVEIIPKFYYVSNDGTTTKEVDVYYSETIKGKKMHLVKLGGKVDNGNIKQMRLSNTYTAVPQAEMERKAQLLGITMKELKAQIKDVYTFNRISIPSEMRTFVGGEYLPNGVYPYGKDRDVIDSSVQRWYFEYYLPSDIHICPKGYDLIGYVKQNGAIDYKEDFWIKGGYIKVSFDITTKPSEADDFDLSYINSSNESNGFCNMWRMEGYQYTKKDVNNITFHFGNGDSLMYYNSNGAGPRNEGDGDGSKYTPGTAADDYTVGGTH